MMARNILIKIKLDKRIIMWYRESMNHKRVVTQIESFILGLDAIDSIVFSKEDRQPAHQALFLSPSSFESNSTVGTVKSG